MNCQQFTLVARSGNYRMVSYCEHGTLYLCWDWATLRLNPAGFEQLLCLLAQGPLEPEATKLTVDSECGLLRQRNGCCQIWVGDIAFFLDPADYANFIDLLDQAARQLEAEPLCPKASVAFDEHCSAATQQPGHHFSTN